jgi:hypothetical protein
VSRAGRVKGVFPAEKEDRRPPLKRDQKGKKALKPPWETEAIILEA